MKKIGRNDPCACGSGKKYKQCCQVFDLARAVERTQAREPAHRANSSIPQALQIALQYHQSGQLQQAEAIYQDILQTNPNHSDALHFLGVLAYQSGNQGKAVELIRKALRHQPSCAMYCNLGLALHAQGKFDAAIESYRKALALQPSYAEAHNNLGNALQKLGKQNAAMECYQQAIACKPDYAEAHSNFGALLYVQGCMDAAVASYQTALSCKPDFSEAHNNLGLALKEVGHFEAAAASFDKAIRCNPDYAEAHNNLGNLLQGQGQLEASIGCYCNALSIKPDYAEAHNNLGLTLQQQGKSGAAIERYQQAIRLLPNYAQAYSNLGNVYQEQGALDQAIACYRHALMLRPELHTAHSNLLFCLNYHPDLSAQEIYEEYRRWNARHALSVQGQYSSPVARGNETSPQTDSKRRLRIGYVSPDLRQHPIQHFIEPLLANHDKSQVELYAYAQVTLEDEVSLRLKHHVDHWHSTIGLSDTQLVEQIRQDQIDILVDLAGHTHGNRLLAFARKPAPIQVSCFGYGATTGLDSMDYFLADAHFAPEGCESLFSEQIVRLPISATYRSAPNMGEVSALPAAKNKTITFASLSRRVRINHHVIRTWAAILQRIPHARLVINSGDMRSAELRTLIQQQFASHGIAAERLELGFESPPWDLLRNIDISLDCFPHNSGTTLYESLYMGVPYVTLASRPSVGRIGAALLHGVGHSEWIAQNEAEYVEKAVALASDLGHLAHVRARLRSEMQASPLMDEISFARSVEAAYRAMWLRWCAEQSAPSTKSVGTEDSAVVRDHSCAM